MTRDGIERNSAARALAPALIVLALIGVVAIAAAGSTPSGSNVVRAPHGSVVDTILTLFLVAAIPALLIYVYGLLYAYEFSAKPAKAGNMLYPAVTVILVALLAYVWLRSRNSAEEPIGEEEFPGGALQPGPEQPGVGSTHEPEFVWWAVLVLAALVVAGFAIWYVTLRRQVRRLAGDTVSGALALMFDETLDDVRAEKDPRRAVIAAYARLERVLALHQLGRRPAEAPHEYLSRILPRLELERGSVRQLTELFTRAKFSPHDIDARMKNDAIEALTTVRDELRAADERRRERQLAALRPEVERP
jgi:Domain of unknown function (DUF4129)